MVISAGAEQSGCTLPRCYLHANPSAASQMRVSLWLRWAPEKAVMRARETSAELSHFNVFVISLLRKSGHEPRRWRRAPRTALVSLTALSRLIFALSPSAQQGCAARSVSAAVYPVGIFIMLKCGLESSFLLHPHTLKLKREAND
jgi:hypothetical protein